MRNRRQPLLSIDTNQLILPKLKSDIQKNTSNNNNNNDNVNLLEELRIIINNNIQSSNKDYDRANIILVQLMKISNNNNSSSISSTNSNNNLDSKRSDNDSFFNYSLPTSKTSINSSPFKIYNDKINDINDDNKNSIIIENMNDDTENKNSIIIENITINNIDNDIMKSSNIEEDLIQSNISIETDTSSCNNNTTVIINENDTTLTSNNDCDTTICIETECNITDADINISRNSICIDMSSSPIFTEKECDNNYFNSYNNDDGKYNISVTVDSSYVNDFKNIENESNTTEYNMTLMDENGEFKSVIMSSDLNFGKHEEVEREQENNNINVEEIKILEEISLVMEMIVVEEQTEAKDIIIEEQEEIKVKVPKRRRRGSVCPSKALVEKVEKEQKAIEDMEIESEKPLVKSSRRLLANSTTFPIIDNLKDNDTFDDLIDDNCTRKNNKKSRITYKQNDKEKDNVITNTVESNLIYPELSLQSVQTAFAITQEHTLLENERNIILCVLTAIISYGASEEVSKESLAMLLQLVPFVLPSAVENDYTPKLNDNCDKKKVHFAIIDGSGIQTPDDRRPSSWEASMHACKRLMRLLNEIKAISNEYFKGDSVNILKSALSSLSNHEWVKKVCQCVETVVSSTVDYNIVWEFSNLMRQEVVEKNNNLVHRITWMISSIIRAHLRWIFDLPPPQISSLADINIDTYRSDLHKYVCLKMKPIPVTSSKKKSAKKKNDTDSQQSSNILEFTLSNLVTIALRQIYLAMQHTTMDQCSVNIANMDSWFAAEWTTSSLSRKLKIAYRVIAAVKSRDFLLNVMGFPSVIEINKKCTEQWKIIEECSKMLFENSDDLHFTFFSGGLEGLLSSLSDPILSSDNIEICLDTISSVSGVTSLTNRRVIQNLADDFQVDTYQIEDIILECSCFLIEFPELSPVQD